MVNNCLVTKLNSSVDNPNLEYISEISTNLYPSGDIGIFICGVDNADSGSTFVELVGDDDAYFADANRNPLPDARKMILPVSNVTTIHFRVMNATENTKIRVNNYNSLYTWQVTNGVFDASYFNYMKNLASLIIHGYGGHRGGIITEDGYKLIENSPINNTFRSYFDGFDSSSSYNPGPILTFKNFLNIYRIQWASADGTHESLVKALWENGKRGGDTMTMNTPHVTINGQEPGGDGTVYYKFTETGVTIYDTLNSSTYELSGELAHYDGSSWTYNNQ